MMIAVKKDVLGVPVVGNISDAGKYIFELGVEHVILAIPTLDVKKRHGIVSEFKKIRYHLLCTTFCFFNSTKSTSGDSNFGLQQASYG